MPSRPTVHGCRIASAPRAAAAVALGAVLGHGLCVIPEAVAQPFEVARPERAKLSIAAPIGASIRVDGTFVGTAPLSSLIGVRPGQRVVSVTMNGFEARSNTVCVEPGTTETVSVVLEPTDQRYASWILIGTGTAGISAGVLFGVLSVIEHREARDLQQRSDTGVLADDDQRAYDAALAARDDFRVGSGIAASVGLASLLVGAALYVLDGSAEPAPAEVRRDDGESIDGVPAARRLPQLDLSATPIIAPSFAGGTSILRF